MLLRTFVFPNATSTYTQQLKKIALHKNFMLLGIRDAVLLWSFVICIFVLKKTCFDSESYRRQIPLKGSLVTNFHLFLSLYLNINKVHIFSTYTGLKILTASFIF